MLFSSSTFLLLFLPVVFILNFICKKEYSNILLLVASLVFYAWGEPVYVLLMILSILINWGFGIIIGRSSGNYKKFALAFAVACDLGILGYYKYASFFVSIINILAGHEIITPPEIILPIGISFFTFQAISYIVDVYMGDTDASNNLINVALYISFFPQLIAGPIVKYKDINKQIECRNITSTDVSCGFKRFIYGLAKKVLIANVLGLCVDTIYSYDISTLDFRAVWIGALAYTFQIYYDFSGYSDMAIGLARMFGFNISENFNYPYMSHSISEFWRRWHISLGTWFKEYVYIPLGGNKKGTTRTYLNLFFVFFLTGLWHGADFSFVLWGLYHGIFSIIERLGFKRILDKFKILSVIYCFFIVNVGWVLFRADDTLNGLRYISRMFLPFRHMDLPMLPINDYLDSKTIFISGCAIIGMGVLKSVVPSSITNKWRDSFMESIFCLALLILCLSAIASNSYNPFIYFQF